MRYRAPAWLMTSSCVENQSRARFLSHLQFIVIILLSLMTVISLTSVGVEFQAAAAQMEQICKDYKMCVSVYGETTKIR